MTGSATRSRSRATRRRSGARRLGLCLQFRGLQRQWCADACDQDVDSDSVIDACDNCPTVANPDQADADGGRLRRCLRYLPTMASLEWTQRTPEISPSARDVHAMAYDSARGVTVLFGGIPGSDETWEWDGTHWSQRFPAASPIASYHAMAYDSARGVTVLFGGASGNETWEWDGTDWSQRFPTSATLATLLPRDGLRQRPRMTVLFGGITDGGLNGETWEWDGTDWSQEFPAPPLGALLSRDGLRQRPRSDPAVRRQTRERLRKRRDLEWDGANWLQRFSAIAPGLRSTPAMAYDSAPRRDRALRRRRRRPDVGVGPARIGRRSSPPPRLRAASITRWPTTAPGV